MVYSKGSNFYRRSNIETAGKLDLIIMCYDKAILCLSQAKNHIIEKEYSTKGIKIKNALDIINELQMHLDLDKGGNIAKSLDSIYSYLTTRIILADINKNFSIFDECINILNELRSAWVGIAEKEKTEYVNTAPTQEIRRLSHQVAA